MKKISKIILIVILSIITIILLDTIQARVFKNSPIISWKENLEDNDSWVDKGIFMNTYYCTKDKDIVTVHWTLKTTKFDCPIDNIENETLKKIVMVRDELYYETFEEATDIWCGTMDGAITSNISIENIPTINNQSNFEGKYEYQIYKENEIVILINNKYIIYRKK